MSGSGSHRQHRILMVSFCIKLVFIVMELGLAIAFGVTEYRKDYDKSAIIEWILALVYIFCKSTRRIWVVDLVQSPANILNSRCLVICARFLARNHVLATSRSRSLPTCEARKRRSGDGERDYW